MVQFHVLGEMFYSSGHFNMPWCTTRYTQYFDTKLHGILRWADINRNFNTFLHLLCYVTGFRYLKNVLDGFENTQI